MSTTALPSSSSPTSPEHGVNEPPVLTITPYRDLIACNGDFHLPFKPIRKRRMDEWSDEYIDGSTLLKGKKGPKKQRIGNGDGEYGRFQLKNSLEEDAPLATSVQPRRIALRLRAQRY